MFEQTHVFTQVELQARNEVKWEWIYKKNTDRSPCIRRFGHQSYYLVATRYQSLLLDNVFPESSRLKKAN